MTWYNHLSLGRYLGIVVAASLLLTLPYALLLGVTTVQTGAVCLLVVGIANFVAVNLLAAVLYIVVTIGSWLFGTDTTT